MGGRDRERGRDRGRDRQIDRQTQPHRHTDTRPPSYPFFHPPVHTDIDTQTHRHNDTQTQTCRQTARQPALQGCIASCQYHQIRFVLIDAIAQIGIDIFAHHMHVHSPKLMSMKHPHVSTLQCISYNVSEGLIASQVHTLPFACKSSV